MDKKLDFRVQHTYRTLQDALMSLLKEKSFDEMTVGELCDRAMIRRATFYKHFGDKYELFAFSIRTLLEQFASQNRLIDDPQRPQRFYISMIDYSLQFVQTHQDIFLSLMKSHSSQVLFDILASEIEQDIRLHLRQDEKNGAILPAKPELLATMMTGALVYTMKWWVTDEMRMPREELVQVCTSFMRLM